MREGGRAPRICGWGERVVRKRTFIVPLRSHPYSLILRADTTMATAIARATEAAAATAAK